MIVFAAVIVFTMAACGGGGGSEGGPQEATYTGTSGGTTYTLKITENTARYTAQSGDDYELTVGSKKSRGKVDNVLSGVLTLKPSNAETTFTATVSESGLTAMSGTITWSDGEIAAAPSEMTPVNPNPVNPNPGTGGTFTITGIPSEYNGKYAILDGGDDDSFLLGAQSINMSTQTVTLSPISNGKVSIPMWKVSGQTVEGRYSGNDTVQYVYVGISSAQTSLSVIGMIAFHPVTFSNGNATKSWSEGQSSPSPTGN
jgi:hypothetical protein